MLSTSRERYISGGEATATIRRIGAPTHPSEFAIISTRGKTRFRRRAEFVMNRHRVPEGETLEEVLSVDRKKHRASPYSAEFRERAVQMAEDQLGGYCRPKRRRFATSPASRAISRAGNGSGTSRRNVALAGKPGRPAPKRPGSRSWSARSANCGRRTRSCARPVRILPRWRSTGDFANDRLCSKRAHTRSLPICCPRSAWLIRTAMALEGAMPDGFAVRHEVLEERSSGRRTWPRAMRPGRWSARWRGSIV